jgi:carbamoyl-phosphate synthase large subunit
LEYPEIEKIIISDKIDGILATCGGQTALNLGVELHEKGILQKHNVILLGVNILTIQKAENRQLFKELMQEIGEPVCDSVIAKDLQSAINFSNIEGFPLIIRPSLTLGGTGGGIANCLEEFEQFVKNGLELSPIGEVLVEKSIYGLKEAEYEIIRDGNDTCICVCNMENFDPVGIHTGDSIVVAPSQTLNDRQYQMLRSSAIKIVRALNIEGACNVQFGLDPETDEYIVIEVNPRLSRSSALASKATAYPIAKIAAKIAVGKKLHEITNDISGITSCFEPSLDYIVCKVPTFPFDKFPEASRVLGTQMKATGEYMGIGLTFEESLLKCISKQEILKKLEELQHFSIQNLLEKVKIPTDQRLFQIIELLNRYVSIQEISDITFINVWFLVRLKNILDFDINKKPYFRAIDGSAGEFDSKTNYIYSTKEVNEHEILPLSEENSKGKIIILGSSAIKIGQGIEFDYASVHAVKSLKKLGYKTIMVNNNPETISTDYNLADRLYFEPIDSNIIKQIYDFEQADGILIQFGGQIALNVGGELEALGLKILGTNLHSIDTSEDRQKFNDFLNKLKIKQPKGIQSAVEDVENNIAKINFPVIIRPSYVIGGSKMKVCNNLNELNKYLLNQNKKDIVFIDEFIEGMEFEVDLISSEMKIFIPLIAEHIEPSGIHSGDSQVIYPAQNLSDKCVKIIEEYSEKIVKSLNVIGLINIQFVIKNGEVFVIEVNLRASRTLPVINKVCNINMIDLAIQAILNSDFDIPKYKIKPAIKKPIFSNSKITKEAILLGPEMKSTGEELAWL